jgi:hypothetical protein
MLERQARAEANVHMYLDGYKQTEYSIMEYSIIFIRDSYSCETREKSCEPGVEVAKAGCQSTRPREYVANLSKYYRLVAMYYITGEEAEEVKNKLNYLNG